MQNGNVASVKFSNTDHQTDVLASMTILLVEDDGINQLVVKRLLERRGHAVTVAENGLDALALLGHTAFDCVLMDVEMPVLGGVETLARLRDATVYGPAAATPVVALTAHTAPGFREGLLLRGFNDFVPKPLDMAELEAALTRVAVGATPGASAHAPAHRGR